MSSSVPSSTDQVPETGRLQATFESRPFGMHGAQWDLLWKDSFTPWDRGGPSAALAEVLSEHAELFPSAPHPSGAQARALVPGCGRGHDVLLLSAFGYDTTGLDVSATSLEQAAQNERAAAAVYAPRRGKKGHVKWIVEDFFNRDGSVLEKASFDLIYDYTFLCALPPEARPRWARRMSELLRPQTGRLVCLEWPLHKAPSAGGPPWGLSPDTYLAHLSHPGTELAYDGAGLAVPAAPGTESPAPALKRLCHLKPSQTHKSGYDEAGNISDFISVWGHTLS